MKPLISIIVPVYNCQNTLDRCLNSIRNQTESNLEIIVVDDGSTDKSFQIIKKHSIEDKRIKVIRQNNMGVSAARNRAIKIVSGSYISFIDADDYVEKNYIEELYIALYKHNTDISLCSCIKENSKGERIFERKKNLNPRCFSVNDGYSYILDTASVVVWGALYKKKILENIQFQTDLFVSEDTLFFAEAAKNSSNIVHTYKELYHYIIYPSSASHGKFSERKYTQLDAWERVCELFFDNRYVYCSARCQYSICCYHMIINYYRDKDFKREFYHKTLNIYRKNLKWFYISKETSFPKKIFRTIFAICPVLFVKRY